MGAGARRVLAQSGHRRRSALCPLSEQSGHSGMDLLRRPAVPQVSTYPTIVTTAPFSPRKPRNKTCLNTAKATTRLVFTGAFCRAFRSHGRNRRFNPKEGSALPKLVQ